MKVEIFHAFYSKADLNGPQEQEDGFHDKDPKRTETKMFIIKPVASPEVAD